MAAISLHSNRCFISIGYLLFIFAGSVVPTSDHEQEICQWGKFNATCAQDEVIVMKSALYGRISKCVTDDKISKRSISCSSELLLPMDSLCSGRRNCSVALIQPSFRKHYECPDHLMPNMLAKYSCVQVHTAANQTCNGGLLISGRNQGYIGNVVTEKSGHGSADCPWIIRVAPGQRINITLMDFTLDDRGVYPRKDGSVGFPTADQRCIVFAVVRETKSERGESTICAGRHREWPVYTSATDQIEIRITGSSSKSERSFYFLLKYQALGCADPSPPQHAWYSREEDRASVKCNFTSQTWHLVCKNNEWFGEIGNCSDAYAWDTQTSGIWPPYGLLIAIIIGILIGILFGLCLLILVYWCRRQRRESRTSKRRPSSPNPSLPYEVGRRLPDNIKNESPKSEVGYTHVWELSSYKPPQPIDDEIGKIKHARIGKGQRLIRDMGQQPMQLKPMHHNTLPSRSKEHVYESPRVERFGTIARSVPQKGRLVGQPHSMALDANAANAENARRERTKVKLDDREFTSDDSDAELDRRHGRGHVRIIQGRAYRPVHSHHASTATPPSRSKVIS